MIRVDRNREEDGVKIRPAETWFRKAQKQTEKAIEEGPGHKVSPLYKDVEVKKALEKLFYDKCAYCETRLISGDWDVEHYRPKGRVAERSDHQGYYWLAYTWENLYPACTFCNQMRKDAPRFDDPQELPALGKLDQFPLGKEENRAMKPGDDLTKENPLLLSPGDDDPEKHFTYDIHGQIFPLEDNDLKAKETIRVCNLRRRRLRDNRARTILRVCKIIKIIALAGDSNKPEVEAGLNSLLEEFTDPSSEYAGAARAVKRNPIAFG